MDTIDALREHMARLHACSYFFSRETARFKDHFMRPRFRSVQMQFHSRRNNVEPHSEESMNSRDRPFSIFWLRRKSGQMANDRDTRTVINIIISS